MESAVEEMRFFQEWVSFSENLEDESCIHGGGYPRGAQGWMGKFPSGYCRGCSFISTQESNKQAVGRTDPKPTLIHNSVPCGISTTALIASVSCEP